MTLRIDPRILESLEQQLKDARDRSLTYAEGSQQRDAAEAHIRQQEDQLARVKKGAMGVPQ